MNKKIATFAVIALVVGLGAGFLLGFAPYYFYMNSSSGGPGATASLLSGASQMLNDGPSQPLTADQVLKKQVRLANQYTVNSALYYCAMKPEYRLVAKRAASALNANQFVTSSGNSDAAKARSYLIQQADNGSGCSPFALQQDNAKSMAATAAIVSAAEETNTH